MSDTRNLRRKIARLKLRGTALLAEGGEPFNAAVLFHEAVELERRAVRDLKETHGLLESAVERCWSLLDGMDPFGARAEWNEVRRLAKFRDDAGAFTARLKPRYTKAQREFDDSLKASPILYQSALTRRLVPPNETDRQAALVEALKLLEQWVGVPVLWWITYRLESSLGNQDKAWICLQHAYQLSPHVAAYKGMMIQFVPVMMPEDEALKILRTVSEDLGGAHHAVVLQYLLAELRLTYKGIPTSRPLEDVFKLGRLALADSQDYGRFTQLLDAVVMLIDTRLKGHRPSFDIFRRANLHDLIPAEAPDTELTDESQIQAMFDSLIALAERETSTNASPSEVLATAA